MPKAVLEFNLPEEEAEFQIALTGNAARTVLWELDNMLRGMVKYEDKDTININTLREILGQLMQERGISLYE